MLRIKIILILVLSLIAASLIAITSAAQSPSSTSTTNRTGTRQIAPAAPAPQDFSKNTWELPDDADKTKNPVATTPESIAKGKDLYLAKEKGNCVFCHGEDGTGNAENLAKLRRKPANLADKERMTSMTDGELFWKISKGITGIMPAGEKRMSDEERWNVVNYIRTLAKEKQ